MRRCTALVAVLVVLSIRYAYPLGQVGREIDGGGPGTTTGGGHDSFLLPPSLGEEEPFRNADIGPLGVVLSNGEYQTSVTDLEIPGRGIPFRLTRTYRSKRDFEPSFLGWNWQLGFDEYLRWGSSGDASGAGYPAIEWRMGNGWRALWVDREFDGTYEAFSGFFGKIRVGPQGGLQIRYPDGTIKHFRDSVLRPNGLRVWALSRIEDRNGNILEIRRRWTPEGVGLIDTVTDTLGRAVRFQYDGRFRLVSAVDFAGRRVDYGYDAAGNLAWVKAPEVRSSPTGNNFCDPAPSAACADPRRTTRYTYAGGCGEPAISHNLIAITDARGSTFLRNTYFSASGDPACGPQGPFADQVASQEYGGTIRYEYASFPVPPDAPADLKAAATTVTDGNGNVRVHEFNSQGNPIRIVTRTNRGVRALAGEDEPDYVETYAYVDIGTIGRPMLVSSRTESGGFTVDALGNLVRYETGMTTRYVYDSSNPDVFQRGNLLSVERIPGSRGAPAGQSSLVIRTAYEPLFNRPVSVTDPSGHVTRFTYDYQEAGYAELTAGPFPAAVDPEWWRGGEIRAFLETPGNSHLGDLNGDGYRRSGNPVRLSEGIAEAADGSWSPEIATIWAYNRFGLPVVERDAEGNETHTLYFPESDPDGDGVATPPPPDGRILDGVAGRDGGGYLQAKILDATPTLPVPPGDPGRQGGQNPPPRNVRVSFAYDPAGNVRSATDGRGIRTDYLVNPLNQVVRIVRAAAAPDPAAPALQLREEFLYDAAGNVRRHRLERRDDGSPAPPASRRWVSRDFEHDALNRTISETVSTDDVPPLSLTTRYAYDASGNLRKMVYPAGNAVLRFHDERNLLFEEVVPASPSPDPADMSIDRGADSVTRHDYDGSGNEIQITDPGGHVARNRHDGYGRRTVSFDPALQRTVVTYDPGDRITSTTAFGAAGGPTPSPGAGGAPVMLSRELLFYDGLGRVRRSDAWLFSREGGAQTFITTDSNAGLTTFATGDPPTRAGDGIVTTVFRYDRLGRVVGTTDDKGRSNETRYDGLGRKLRVSLPSVHPFVYEPVNAIDERNTVVNEYDAAGNLLAVVETEWGTDRSASPPRKLPPQQFRTEHRYDALNRLVETRFVGRMGAPPLNLVSTFVYDGLGNLIQATDPVGNRRKSFYDGAGRLLRAESGYSWDGVTEIVPATMRNAANPDGVITTRYGYDANGRPVFVTDDNGRTTTYSYDARGLRTRVTYPDGSFRGFRHDRDSLPVLVEHVGVGGSRLALTTMFDALHRAVQRNVDASGAPAVVGTRQQRYEYDGLGRMTRAIDDQDPADSLFDSEVRLAHDSLGRTIADSQIFRVASGGQIGESTHTVRSLYDGVGFRQRLEYPESGRVLTFSPDALDRIETLVDSHTGSFGYDYLGPSRLLNRRHPNGTELTLLDGPTDGIAAGYDAARRVVKLTHRDTGTGGTLAGFTYGYDGSSNRRFERRAHEPAGIFRRGEAYSYDAADRLITWAEGSLDASGTLQGAPASSRSFTLDGPGNWREHTTGAVSHANAVNELNQYLKFRDPYGLRRLAYDFTGNLSAEILEGIERQYAYDFDGRLVLYLDPGGTLHENRYDAIGRKVATLRNGEVHTRFLHDGSHLLEERDGGDSLVASYVYGAGTDEILTRRRWQGALVTDLTYHANALGSVAAVSDREGRVVERYRYDAYGAPLFLDPGSAPIPRSAVFNNLLFTGRYYEPESGLYDFRRRAYHPVLGRFLQRDPLGEAASLNLYAYVFDNPINATDPTGLYQICQPYVFNSKDPKAHQKWVVQTDREWRASTEAAMRFLDEATRHQGIDMEAKFRAGVEALDAAYWAERAAAKQEQRDGEIQQQVDRSLERSAANLDNPVAITVIIYGRGQDIEREYQLQAEGKSGRTGLDALAGQLRDQGHVVIEIESDSLARVGSWKEPSASGLEIVAEAVRSVSHNGSSGADINILGYSRGGAGAIGLTNALDKQGIQVDRLALLDPQVGRNSARILDTMVNAKVFDVKFSLTQFAASLLGFRNRVQQGAGNGYLSPSYYRTGHTSLDSFGRGALGDVHSWFTGGP
jgi:RHS repeat-associated protein